MVDLRFIDIKDVLKLVSVAYVPNSDPPTLLVRGKDFNYAEEVFLNESKSPDVVITSGNSLLAQIPETQTAVPLRSVVVVSSRLTSTDRSLLSFRISDNPGGVDGLTRLIQSYLKIMLQAPKTDIWSPKVGGGLLRSVGKQVTNPSGSSMVSDFHLAATRARQQLMALQARNPRISMTERLLYARVVDAKFNPKELSLVGKISLGNQVGQGSVVGLGL